MNKDILRTKFGKNLARIRNQVGLTHEEMDDYGISRAYYGKVELGTYSISLDKLDSISKAFGVPIYQLFIDENGEPL